MRIASIAIFSVDRARGTIAQVVYIRLVPGGRGSLYGVVF